MENNTLAQEAPKGTIPTPSLETKTAKPQSRFWMLFLALFILGIFFLGGTYYFVSSQKATYIPAQINNETIDTQKDVIQLEGEAAALDIQDVDSDFTQVDAELKNL